MGQAMLITKLRQCARFFATATQPCVENFLQVATDTASTTRRSSSVSRWRNDSCGLLTARLPFAHQPNNSCLARLCSPLPPNRLADAVRDSSACQSVSIASRLLHASRILQTPSLTSLLCRASADQAGDWHEKVLCKSDSRGLHAHSEPSQESPQGF